MIQPPPSAPLGSVTTLLSYRVSDFSPSDAILCRVTAPLIAFAFALIERGVGVRVLGRDIGAGLVTTIRSCKATSLDELEQVLIRKRQTESAREYRRGNDQGAAAIEDKYDCLNIFLQHERRNRGTIASMAMRIENLFDEKRRGLLTLSTIHKAKGLEWPTVFILDAKKLMPSKWATQEWQQKQERNLGYVARTRAKLHLKFITSNCWRKEGEEKCRANHTTEREDQSSPVLTCNPPPTFNPDAVEPSLSLDTSADDDYIGRHIYDSVRITSNPDDPNCHHRIP